MSDFNDRRIENIKAEKKYQAAWDAVFSGEEVEIVHIKTAGWDDNEKCECGKNIKYCKYPNCQAA
jgi:hypothetical protein